MKLIDDRGKLFGLINIIDLLIVLIVIAVIGRFAWKREAQKPSGVQTQTIEVVLLVKDVRDATVDAIKEGDLIRETKSNVVLGKITNIEVKPADTLVNTADGKVVAYPNPILKDIYVTVTGTGTAGENAIVLGKSEIRIGTTVAFKTNTYAVVSTVMGIKVL